MNISSVIIGRLNNEEFNESKDSMGNNNCRMTRNMTCIMCHNMT